MPDTDAARLTAWQVSLDRIELDVIRAERALAAGTLLVSDPWDVPADHGPLPPALRDRAQALHERQLAVLERIAATLGTTVRQQALVDAVSRTAVSDRTRPVYVDQRF
ncbi:hypothetical protein K8Z61_16770 [Nocardioides sp. TRM66260-LWL]|uniref:hypothetical protein n=1 Tax=Nocardioides sp. TRM66260-LWL TaxID=2874478 RepID=UPI001CC7ECD8|nr:hypothetical protein [Nocardioides sp. TRM66260-LWL]MBZ5736148.1 hypothetical protein [Nocardioides sp. TRM66260-LWL]